MRSHSAGDRGSITAEFAAVVPAVMLVLAGSLVCLQLGSQQLRLQDAAAVLAVRLMIPLGVCVLPAFMALGVAPLLIAVISSTVAGF